MAEIEVSKPKSGPTRSEVSPHVPPQQERVGSLTPLLAFSVVLLFALIIIGGLVLILS